jgi:hypothetical protein
MRQEGNVRLFLALMRRGDDKSNCDGEVDVDHFSGRKTTKDNKQTMTRKHQNGPSFIQSRHHDNIPG